MILKIIDNEHHGLSEEGLISLLTTGSAELNPKPKPNIELALMALDFWETEWDRRGVIITRAELNTEFDPEESFWYFTIDLYCKMQPDIRLFAMMNLEIIDEMITQESLTRVWWDDYTVITHQEE